MTAPRKQTPDRPAAAAPPPAPSNPLFDDVPGESKALVPQVEGAIAPNTFVSASVTKRETALGTEVESSRESIAVAAQIKAEIAARSIHAMQHPRSFDAARSAILTDCKRPAFAKAAIYAKPVSGQKIEGLSIRFAETALRHWGNVATLSIITDDNPVKRAVRIAVTDLETNTTHARDIVLLKAVERRFLKDGQKAIDQRVNSTGQTVYLVEATEDELATKEAAARSKVMRNEGLRLIPADILDEALAVCRRTRGDSDAADPAAARKEIVDAFAEINISVARLEEYVGCPLAEAGPGQLGDLRDVYRAVRDGDATMQDFVAARVDDISAPDGDDAPKSSKVEALKATARAKAEERKAKK